ncbi:MAG: hypothetical protein CVV33_02570 [Methanomicrobiales archaeon HGW-Methanomicrobiales-4]|nr:MAG: hypothetical protein CVV33_02570 [Methanomicrobiales archaeon HGW-Methanomicrobiales-4]
MDNLTSRNEEKDLEQAREMGRKDEHNMQHERDLATEKGVKQGLEKGRARDNRKGGIGTGMKIILCLIVMAIIGIVIAFLTLSVSVTDVSPGSSLPYTTKYGVSFPEGQTLTIGNTHINVLSYQNELISDIDGDRQKLMIGSDRVISERRAVITTLRAITLMDTNFKINLNYRGDRDNRAFFDMSVQTSQQVPDMLIKQLIPPEMDARPI